MKKTILCEGLEVDVNGQKGQIILLGTKNKYVRVKLHNSDKFGNTIVDVLKSNIKF